MATVLNDQQKLLIQQQYKLEEQAKLLFTQNEKIFEQQTLLENQQKEINKANQGLLEAKGLTQEQAQQLVGCIVKVQQAEKRIKEDTAQQINNFKRSQEQINTDLIVKFDWSRETAQELIQKVKTINQQIEENKKATEDELVKVANKIKLAEEQFNEKLMLEIARVDDEHQSFVQALNQQIEENKKANEDKFIKVEYFDNKINLLESAHQKYRKQNYLLLTVLTFVLLISLILQFKQFF